MNGAIDIEYLEKLPLDKYIVVKRAAEIEEISQRLKLISDVNAAFFGGGDHTKKLQQLYDKLMGHDVSWENDPKWAEKLKKYKR